VNVSNAEVDRAAAGALTGSMTRCRLAKRVARGVRLIDKHGDRLRRRLRILRGMVMLRPKLTQRRGRLLLHVAECAGIELIEIVGRRRPVPRGVGGSPTGGVTGEAG